jgi:predicted N-acetyltransferase YhbS
MTEEEDRLRVRSMQAEDIDAILTIDRKIGGVQRAITYEMERYIGGQFDLSFVAEVDDGVVGFVLAALTYIPEQVTEACTILTVSVDPDYQQQGIARKLIQTVLEASRSKGIRRVRTMIDQNDAQLKGFFECMEFRRGYLIEYFMNV